MAEVDGVGEVDIGKPPSKREEPPSSHEQIEVTNLEGRAVGKQSVRVFPTLGFARLREIVDEMKKQVAIKSRYSWEVRGPLRLLLLQDNIVGAYHEALEGDPIPGAAGLLDKESLDSVEITGVPNSVNWCHNCLDGRIYLAYPALLFVVLCAPTVGSTPSDLARTP